MRLLVETFFQPGFRLPVGNRRTRFARKRSKYELRCWLFAAALTLHFFSGAQAYGQPVIYSRPYLYMDKLDCDVPDAGFFTLDANRGGSALLSLEFCFDPALEREVRQNLPTALGCPAKKLNLTRFEDEGLVGLSVSCEVYFPRQGLRFSGRQELPPIWSELKTANIRRLVIDMWVPLYGEASCGHPKINWVYFPKARECGEVLTGMPGEPQVIQFSFGYNAEQIGRIAGVLGFLLFLPVAMTLWLRRRALSAPDGARVTSSSWFVSWCAIGGVYIWFGAIKLLHANDLVEFVIPSWGLSNAGVRIISVVLLLFLLALVYFFCFLLWSPTRKLQRTRGTEPHSIPPNRRVL